MQNFTSRIPTHQALKVYKCSAAYFWAGLCDWVVERTSSPVKGQPSRASEGTSYWWATLLVALALLLALAVVLAWAGPTLVQGMGLVGTHNVAKLSGLLAVSLGVALALGFPLMAGWRLWKFSHSMCLRGWALETGQRKPFRYV